jgi:formamidopyrimidine-DNA glycosylase
MPELPEVEFAATIVRRTARGRIITSARALHPSQRRGLPDDVARSLVGDRIVGVDRRGKHQLLRLKSGRTLHVHFRMTGDWVVLVNRDQALPPHARVAFGFDDGTRLVLDDPRALSAVTLCAAGVDPVPQLGPEATERAFDARWLAHALKGRRIPIKVALLDQRIVAGVGNIYASEALWYARVDPRVVAGRLRQEQLRAIVSGVRRVMAKALKNPARYSGEGASDPRRFNVYDREGEPCRRCRTRIRRLVQGARSTYFCPACGRK